MKKINQMLLALTMLTTSSIASATLIAGEITFGGTVNMHAASFDYNFVDINLDRAIVTNDPTGSFGTTVSFGDVALYNDFAYEPFTAINPLWTVGGFSFALNEITYISEIIDGQGHMFLSLAGNGIFTGNGFEATEGAWTFSADGVLGGTGEGTFAFSSVNVPEPGVALLLGVGLIGFGVARKLK